MSAQLSLFAFPPSSRSERNAARMCEREGQEISYARKWMDRRGLSAARIAELATADPLHSKRLPGIPSTVQQLILDDPAFPQDERGILIMRGLQALCTREGVAA